ncbi:hypothetical protein [Thermus sp.]|uniref:glycoside hydrolase family 130 protein n=1 Tax=Thermus sp. TaxID=275 RepID=UPI00307D8329
MRGRPGPPHPPGLRPLLHRGGEDGGHPQHGQQGRLHRHLGPGRAGPGAKAPPEGPGAGEPLQGKHRDLSYRHGLARLSPEGELLGLSNYLLAPQGLYEAYGDRPLTLYGNGLLLYGEELIWVGGVGDYAMGAFSAPLEEVLRRVHPV